MAELLELCRRFGRVVDSVGSVEGALKLFGGVVEVYEVDPLTCTRANVKENVGTMGMRAA